jgi:predicted dehydrogenase
MYNVLIIGAGSIGVLKDDKYDSPTTENILTHAHAVKVHPEFNLYTIVDIDQDKLNKARMKWNVVGFRELAYVNNKKIDVVVIATPTETHLDIYSKICKWKLKAVIIEKPCTDSLEHAMLITPTKLKNRIIVNYTRRFIPEYQKLKKNFEKQKILSCIVHYVRGIKRDSCHAINLINYFFGKIEDVKFLSKGPDDYSKEDTTDCFWLKTERCPNVIFLPGDGRIADHFDIEIMTDKGMYCLYNNGSSIYKRLIEKEKIHGDYMSLQGQIYDFTHINFKNRLLMNLYDQVYDFIHGGENPCSIEEAIEVHRVIEKVRGK